MSKVIIKASNAGFHNLSPLGAVLAPNVFLKTGVNVYGLIASTPQGWESRESAMYDDFGIDIVATTAKVDNPKLGMQTEITVTKLAYYRMVDGEKTVIGTLELPEPLIITATYDQIDADNFGWTANLGAALEERVQNEGFAFEGGEGDDIFMPHHTILPFRGHTKILGKEGDDQLSGTLGDDRIMGGPGDDTIYDPDGKNQIFGGGGDDLIVLGDGSDGSYVWGGSGNDTLISGAGSDYLVGASGKDTLIGGAGDDILEGLRDTDTLDGGRGADTLDGGFGDDTLTGGSGADQFIFNTAQFGHDIITDFSNGEDIIILRGISEMNALDMVQTDQGVMLSWGYDDRSIFLENTDINTLNADDFLFI